MGMITDQTIRMRNWLKVQFPHLYIKKDFEIALEKVEKAKPDLRPDCLKKLTEMLNEIGVECDRYQPLSYYRDLVDKLDLPNDTVELNRKILKAIKKIYAKYPSPEDFMTRMVDSLDKTPAEGRSLRLRILRKLVETVNVPSNKNYYCKKLTVALVDSLGESIFDAPADGKKPSYHKMLKGAEELADGNFTAAASAKELLFMFAFAYGMRYYPDVEKAGYSKKLDVVKNLFADYYCDNLVRYIRASYNGETVIEPSGEGLNFKNFVDVAFVYYLNRKGLAPTEKVSRFYGMIHRIKDQWKQSKELDETAKAQFVACATATRVNGIPELLEKSEEDLESYLLENYYCDVRYRYGNGKQNARGLFELTFAVNSPMRQYEDLCACIKSLLYLDEDDNLATVDMRHARDGESESAFAEYGDDDGGRLATRIIAMEANVPDVELFLGKRRDADFEAIMKGIVTRLDPQEALSALRDKKVTRTKLIALFYHYYCLENQIDSMRGNRSFWFNFGELYEDMGICLNDYLVKAGYEPLSEKNVFDMMIIFFAYCKVNNLLEA